MHTCLMQGAVQEWLDIMKSAEASELAQPIKSFVTDFTSIAVGIEERVSLFHDFVRTVGQTLADSPLFAVIHTKCVYVFVLR